MVGPEPLQEQPGCSSVVQCNEKMNIYTYINYTYIDIAQLREDTGYCHTVSKPGEMMA